MNTQHADLDDEDFSTMDHGDDYVPERDASGKFVKAEEKAAPEKEEPEKEESEKAEPEKAEPEKEEPEKEEPGDDDDDKNMTLRFEKMRKQRDEERIRVAALDARLKALEEALPAADKKPAGPSAIEVIQTELDDLYEKVEAARADGDAKDAAALQRQIDTKNREIGRLETQSVATVTSNVVQLNNQYDAMLEIAEATIPEIDPKSDDFDPSMVKELTFQVTAYEKAGMTGPQALHRAIVLLFRVDPFAKQAPAKAEEKKTPPKAEEKKPEPKKTDISKSAANDKKQPPDASKAGVDNDSSVIKPTELSEEDFDKLPESKKAELRGDNL